MKKVFVLGSLNKDLVSYVNKVPEIGETIECLNFKTFNGGKGANQAVAIAKMNISTTMLGAIGEDQYGNDLKNSLIKNKINCDGIIKVKGPSGIATIVVDINSNNFIIYNPGANSKYEIKNLSFLKDNIKNFDFLVSQLETRPQVVLEAFKIARKANKTTILTPAPANLFSNTFLNCVDYLVPNEIEFQTIFGVLPFEENLKLISAKHPDINFIVTLGERGAIYGKNGIVETFPALLVETVDTTAAGDSFLGAFTASISMGNKINDAIRFGIKAASITVTRKGAQVSLPKLKEMKEGINNGKKD